MRPNRSISRKSASTSKRRKLRSFKRGRALRRGTAKFEPFSTEHIKYVWAAYKRGALDEMENLPDDMDAVTFSSWITEILMPVVESGGEVVTLVGKTKAYGEIPLGLATLEYRGRIAYPHAIWFPDSSPRDRLEIGLAFFIELKKNHQAWVTAEQKDETYFEHLGAYGVLRKVGKLRDYFDNGHATLYQTVGH